MTLSRVTTVRNLSRSGTVRNITRSTSTRTLQRNHASVDVHNHNDLYYTEAEVDALIAGFSSSLDGLSDVVITNPQSDEVLKFNGTNWVNGTDTGFSINGLGVDTIASGDFLPFYDVSGSDNNKITFGNFESTLNHNNLFNYSANQHIDHTSVSISAGTGLSGGGTIAANRTISLSHLGFESLTDPGGDRIAFWDDSAGSFSWLTLGTNLSITGTTLNASGGGGSPGGSDTQIQFNDGGAFAGAAGALWDKTNGYAKFNNNFKIGNAAGTPSNLLHVEAPGNLSSVRVTNAGSGGGFYIRSGAAEDGDFSAGTEYTVSGYTMRASTGSGFNFYVGNIYWYTASGTPGNPATVSYYWFMKGSNGNFQLHDGGQFAWSANTLAQGTADTGFARVGAASVKVTDGSTGYGALRASYLAVTDGMTAPSAGTGEARIYVDAADGDLKVKFADGTVKTLATDT